MATARMTDDLLKKLCDKFQEDYKKVNPVPKMSEDLGLKIYKKYVEPMFADMKAVYDTHMDKTTVYGTESKKTCSRLMLSLMCLLVLLKS